MMSPSQKFLPENTHHSHGTGMPPEGFEPAVPTIERAADPRVRPRANLDRYEKVYRQEIADSMEGILITAK